MQEVLAAVTEQKKVTDTLLKQNTSLLLLNAKLTKDIGKLKERTIDLQSSTEELRVDVIATTTTAAASKSRSRSKAVKRLPVISL